MAQEIFPTAVRPVGPVDGPCRTTVLDDGRVLLLWADAAGTALQGRFLDATGAPEGDGFSIAGRADATLTQVVATRDGGFVLTWFERAAAPLEAGDTGYSAAQPTHAATVSLVRYDGTGTATGAARSFTAGADTHVTSARLAAREDGGFTLVAGVAQEAADSAYDGAELISVRLDGAFRPASRLRVLPDGAEHASDDVTVTDIVTLAGGGSVVVYDTGNDKVIPDENEFTNYLYEAYAQVLDDRGRAVGAPILLGGPRPFEIDGTGSYAGRAIALEDGGFVLAWETVYDRPRFRIFDADGSDRMARDVTLSLPFWETLETMEVARFGDGSLVFVLSLRAYATGELYETALVDRDLILRFDAQGRVIQPAAGYPDGSGQTGFDLAMLPDGRVLATWTDAQGVLRSGLLAPLGGDPVFGTGAAETLTGTGGDDILVGGDGGNFPGPYRPDALFGGAGDDLLSGDSGDDTLDGGPGADTMIGGFGNDTYHVDDAGDRIFEEPAGGALDRVFSSVSLDLSHVAVERAKLTGSAHVSLTGGTHSELLIGNAGNNVITGGDGIAESWGQVTGGPETIRGEAGNDLLIGGTGDTLDGGMGDDILQVRDPQDVTLVEGAGGGTDTLVISASFNLRDTAIENLVLGLPGELGRTDPFVAGGSELDNRLTGNAGDNLLLGRQGNDTLQGNAGDDTLNGGAGDDLMVGGAGSDLYMVDSAGDRVVEESRPWDETDTVRSAVDFFLAGTYVENLELAGQARIGRGNGFDNVITGNSAANVLDGDGGYANRLVGGDGSDTYIVRASGDQVVERADGGLADTIRAFVSFALPSRVERLVLAEVGDLNGVGNRGGNVIIGNSGRNTLNGREGNDTLEGMGGADTFVFDRDPGAGNVETIRDFNTNVPGEGDRLLLKATLFADVREGALDSSRLAFGTAAQDADDRFVFDAASGRLWYDADGSGAAEQVLMALFENGAALQASDFEIY